MSELRWFVERLGTPVGDLLLVTDEQARVRALDWTDYEARLHALLDVHYGRSRVRLGPRPAPSPAIGVVAAYLAGDLRSVDAVQTATEGTPFQRAVWQALRGIPPGRTLSYGGLAASLGRATAVRAVARANGANPIGIVVPCHRVVGADGSLTGYAGGLARKRWLLDHEARFVGAAGTACA